MENEQERNEFDLKGTLNKYFWMVMVAVCSLCSLIFLPLVGGDIEKIGFYFPTTAAGWILWCTTKAIVTALNLVIFTCFSRQGKANSKKHPNKLKADELLNKIKDPRIKPARSPEKFTAGIYGKKLITIMLFTLLSTFAFEQAIIGYDWQNALIYGFTIGMGCVMGLINMRTVEIYWTEEYLEYAQQQVQKNNENKETIECSNLETKNSEI